MNKINTLMRSLSLRIKLITFFWLVFVVGAIALTIIFSWRLEGNAAAINEVGGLRFQTYRLAWELKQNAPAHQIAQMVQRFDQSLQRIQHGDRLRPLQLPNTAEIRQQMQALNQHWQQQIRPAFLHQHALNDAQLTPFLQKIDRLAYRIEAVNTQYLAYLRVSQSLLLLVVIVSALSAIALLFAWIMKPLRVLRQGVLRLRNGERRVRVPLDYSTEFAEVDQGFNQMSDHLQQLYDHLEEEVAIKTRDLRAKNHSLETFYFFARLLTQEQQVQTLAQQFLDNILHRVGGVAGSVRLFDSGYTRMSLITHRGLSASLQQLEASQRVEECFREIDGYEADSVPIRFVEEIQHYSAQSKGSVNIQKARQQAGFKHILMSKIHCNGQDLGFLMLYFRNDISYEKVDRALLDTLVNQLGMVISNLHLNQESRQLAVLQERNLIAQGLHDSIAQSLTFLNLQVQMFESAFYAKQHDEMLENLTFIKEGINECYDDVRELLLNFRTKIEQQDFAGTVANLAQRFERQTQIATHISWQGEGEALTSEQQLQFIFILQESLSNVRKHAQATRVQIQFCNDEAFSMRIEDDGRGFDVEALLAQESQHVGLHIMHERAKRIHAELNLHSRAGCTTITLQLPAHARHANRF